MDRDKESEYHYSYYPIPNTEQVLQVRLKRSSNCTAFKTWEACFAFLEWVVDFQRILYNFQCYKLIYLDLFHGKRILELGSGSGLCGQMMQTLLGDCNIIMSDYCNDIAEYINENIEESSND